MKRGALIEMFEVMAELEGMCGRLAARRISEALLRDHVLIQGERFSDFVASVRRFESPLSGTA
jgi:DNA-binding GntR family transcriptional regulator